MRLSWDLYVTEIIEEFGMTSPTYVGAPIIATTVNVAKSQEALNKKLFPSSSLIKKLLRYSSNCTRPNITTANNHLSKLMSQPYGITFDRAKRILMYLNGTPVFRLTFDGDITPEIISFVGFLL